MKLAISLGGSLLVPELPPRKDTFRRYARLLRLLHESDNSLIVVCGGGETARSYQIIAENIPRSHRGKIDKVGIQAAWLNATTLASLLYWCADFERMSAANVARNFGKRILCVGGEEAGHSSDYVTVQLAKAVNADLIINATNVDGIYNRDPNKYKTAELIPEITYESYLERFGQTWKPGMHAPFDFEAARLMLAGLPRIPTRVVNGQRLENILGAAEGKDIGTLLN